MTLVLSALTPTHALQASDRRVVMISRGEIVEENDQRNKAVLFKGNWAFGFTGLADLGAERRTDLWLADALRRADQALPPGDHDPRVLFRAIADRTTAEFQRRAIARLPAGVRRHAFVGVCWGRFPDAAVPLPYLVLISNFHDRQRGELGYATDRFDFFITRARPGASLIVWTGEQLGRSEIKAMKALGRIDPAAGGFAAAAIGLMVEQIRSVAARKQSVGRGVLTVDIPRGLMGEESERFIVHGAPALDHASFQYFPSESDDPVIHGPTYVGEASVMKDFRAWPLPSNSSTPPTTSPPVVG